MDQTSLDDEKKEHKSSLLEYFRKSIFAGVCISIGGTIYLSVGGIAGAFLFSFGLLAVVHYQIPLYTGKAGFCKTSHDIKMLPIILIGNILGAFLFALCIKCAKPDLIHAANDIMKSRASLDLLQLIILPMGCGIIMTTIVKFARKNKFIPLLIGIPVFILCGFIHSIADAFYYSVASVDVLVENALPLTFSYLCAVIGNFIGCVLPNEFLNGNLFAELDSETGGTK